MLTVVIGSGIVGLHLARLLQERGDEVFVLDQAPYFAEHTSGRNSGVIHAGIFYKTGSFKEKICIEGNRLTYEWLKKLNVPHRASGKWVVPEEGQEGELESFFEKISRLPIPPPKKVSPGELKKEAPALRPSEAIFVPSTGIMDAATYVKNLGHYLEEKGVQIILNCEVQEVNKNQLKTTRGEIEFEFCVNSAGLRADEIAGMTGLTDYEIRPCRGDYYLLNRQPVPQPVYHLPYPSTSLRAGNGPLGLGVHLTPTLDGQTLLGPNAFFIDKKYDYHHRSSPESFEQAVQFYLPDLKDYRITEGYCGNRPKLYRRGELVGEFVIEKKGQWVHLLGIESPGMTAAPALAHEVMKLI